MPSTTERPFRFLNPTKAMRRAEYRLSEVLGAQIEADEAAGVPVPPPSRKVAGNVEIELVRRVNLVTGEVRHEWVKREF